MVKVTTWAAQKIGRCLKYKVFLQYLLILTLVTGILGRPEPPVNSYLPSTSGGGGPGGPPSSSYGPPNHSGGPGINKHRNFIHSSQYLHCSSDY